MLDYADLSLLVFDSDSRQSDLLGFYTMFPDASHLQIATGHSDHR